MKTFKAIYCMVSMITSILVVFFSLIYVATYAMSIWSLMALILVNIIAFSSLLGFAEVLETE